MSEPTPESTRASPHLAPIRLQPSRWLKRLHGLLLLIFATLPWLAFVGHGEVSLLWFVILCLFEWLLFLEWRWGRRRWLHAPRVLGYEAGQWYLQWDSEPVGVVPVGQWLVWPWLQVMRFRTSRGVLTLVIAPDGAGKDDRRRLRVWLRTGPWHPQPSKN